MNAPIFPSKDRRFVAITRCANCGLADTEHTGIDALCPETDAEPLPDTNARLLGDLLAVLHGDGGHYQADHGTKKAVEDAIAKWSDLMIRAQGTPETGVDAEVGAVLLGCGYLDRMNDLAPGIDTAADVCRDLLEALRPILARHFPGKGTQKAGAEPGRIDAEEFPEGPLTINRAPQ